MVEYQVVINNGDISIYESSCNSYFKEIVSQKQINYYKSFNKLLINRYINNLKTALLEIKEHYHPNCIYVLLENSTDVIRLIDVLCLKIFSKHAVVIGREKYKILMYRILEKGKLKFWMMGKSIYVGYINKGIRTVNLFTSIDSNLNDIFLRSLQHELPTVEDISEIVCQPSIVCYSIMEFINAVYSGVKIKMVYNMSHYD